MPNIIADHLPSLYLKDNEVSFAGLIGKIGKNWKGFRKRPKMPPLCGIEVLNVIEEYSLLYYEILLELLDRITWS